MSAVTFQCKIKLKMVPGWLWRTRRSRTRTRKGISGKRQKLIRVKSLTRSDRLLEKSVLGLELDFSDNKMSCSSHISDWRIEKMKCSSTSSGPPWAGSSSVMKSTAKSMTLPNRSIISVRDASFVFSGLRFQKTTLRPVTVPLIADDAWRRYLRRRTLSSSLATEPRGLTVRISRSVTSSRGNRLPP